MLHIQRRRRILPEPSRILFCIALLLACSLVLVHWAINCTTSFPCNVLGFAIVCVSAHRTVLCVMCYVWVAEPGRVALVVRRQTQATWQQVHARSCLRPWSGVCSIHRAYLSFSNIIIYETILCYTVLFPSLRNCPNLKLTQAQQQQWRRSKNWSPSC